jgi:hypothetical protein
MQWNIFCRAFILLHLLNFMSSADLQRFLCIFPCKAMYDIFRYKYVADFMNDKLGVLNLERRGADNSHACL